MLNPERHAPSGRLALKRRVFNAGGWLVVGYGVNLTLRLGTNLLMTHLLMPEMFGIMAMATVVLVGLAMFSDLGLRQCIVRSERGQDPAFLNTAWTIQLLQGVLLWLAALAASAVVWILNVIGAFPLHSVYADPALPYVIAALASTVLIGGTISTKSHEASRRLGLGPLAQLEVISQVVGLLCMLAWVTMDRSIWALVAGAISASLTRAVLSHVWLSGSSNRLHWDGASFREIVGFGKWMFVSSILGFLVNNGDRLLLGGLVSSSLLGVYAIAYLLFSAIEQVLATVIGELTFPALSEIARERRAELKASYYRFQAVIASLSYASAGALIVAGQTIVDALYDQRYRSAGWMLEILAVGFLAVPWRSASLCLLALGVPQILSYSSAARLAALVLAVPFGFHVIGVAGAMWGIVFAQLATVPVIVIYMAKCGVIDFRRELLLLVVVPASVLVAKAGVLAIGASGAIDAVSALVRLLADFAHLRIHSQVQLN